MKKFFKKPLNLVSFVLAVLGLIGIAVMLIVPHGKTYTATMTVGDNEVHARMVLKDGKIYASTKADDKWTDEVAMGEYSISKGKISYKLGAISTELGEINAFRFIPGDSEDVKYTCKMTVVFFVVACAMLVVGATGMAYGTLSSKKKKK